MRGMDFHRAAALGERPKRAGHDRTTQKHHADERSRTRRRIQAMTPVPRREDHRVCLSGYSKSLAAPPASPRRLRAVIFGHDGSRSCTSCGLTPALPHAWHRFKQTIRWMDRKHSSSLSAFRRARRSVATVKSHFEFGSNCRKVTVS